MATSRWDCSSPCRARSAGARHAHPGALRVGVQLTQRGRARARVAHAHQPQRRCPRWAAPHRRGGAPPNSAMIGSTRTLRARRSTPRRRLARREPTKDLAKECYHELNPYLPCTTRTSRASATRPAGRVSRPSHGVPATTASA